MYEKRIYPSITGKKHTSTAKTDITSEYRVEKKIFQSNGPKKQASVVTLISNKIEYQLKLIKRDGEVCFILITG